MTELLKVYDLDGVFLYEQERKEFYAAAKKEAENTGEITKKVATIRCFVMNSKGKIYLQKRSRAKAQNAGLYDKTIGGHVVLNQSTDVTLTKECAEELGIPASIVDRKEFTETLETTDLSIVGVFTKVDTHDTFMSLRNLEDGVVLYPQITSIYIGRYDGPIKFIDGEVCGIETFSLQELEDDIEAFPEKFTEDVKWMLEEYKKYL